MGKMEDIEKRINGAMDSLNNIEGASPRPFFYTRLQARLQKNEKNLWETMSRVITRPAIALMSLSLVMLVNILVLLQLNAGSVEKPTSADISIAEEYSRITSYYDLENAEP